MARIIPLLKARVWEKCLNFFSSVFSFCKIKGYYYIKYRFYRLCVLNPASRLLVIGCKLGKWPWRFNFPIWRQSQIFWRCFVSLAKFRYWSKFHVNVITGSGVMTISFYKELTRNPEIGNTLFWVRINIWILGRARNTKFDKNISTKCYWMLPNSRVTAFTISE